MSAHPTSNIPTRGMAIVGSVIASLAFTTGVASAEGPTVTQLEGNPTCASLGAGYYEVKVDHIRQGRTAFGDGTLSGTIVVKGLEVDWSASPGVDAVIVKGGPRANVYRADDEMTSGTGLTAPIDPSNGRPHGVSHVSFCSDRVDAPVKPAAGPCEPGGPTTMADGQPCVAATAAPAPPRGEVLSAHAEGGQTPASAQMSAPSACVSRAYLQVVRGKGIRKVTLFVNGKRIRTLRGARSRYAATVDPRRYPSGVMRLKARVEFVRASGRRAQTFRMTVLRCSRAAVGPAFTG